MLTTPLTKKFKTTFPIVLAPMAPVSRGRLAGAVAREGGIGFIAGATSRWFSPEWIDTEYKLALSIQQESEAGTCGAVGIGFIGCLLIGGAQDPSFLRALQLAPAAGIFVSFGPDEAPLAPLLEAIHAAGIPAWAQVFTLEQAEQAQACGAEVIVMQGCDAGGHGEQFRGTSIMSLVPAAQDALEDRALIVAAGGIADGRGIAAALCLGASGALLGSRFQVTEEAVAREGLKEAIAACSGGPEASIVTKAFERIGLHFYEEATARALRDNETVRRFHAPLGGEQKSISEEDRQWFEEGGSKHRGIWCSASVGQINDIPTVKELMARLVAESKARFAQPLT